MAGRDRIGLAELCAHPLALGSPGTTQRELFGIGAFVRAGGGLALVGDLGDLGDAGPDTGAEGVTHVRVDHPVFRQREAQVQTVLGRRLPWSAAQFTESLVALVRGGTELR